MSLIEQAARRLEELRRAGAEIPDATPESAAGRVADNATAVEKVGTLLQSAPATAPIRSLPASKPAVPPDPPKHASIQVTAPARDEPAIVDPRRVTLNLQSIAAAGIVTPDTPRTRLADEFRVVKRPLIANATGKGAVSIRNGNLIMITSALPGEGKSFTAINLAMSIAMELDHTVLLVDADVARPSLPRILGIPSTPGLLDILVDESIELSHVLLRTNVEKLTVLLGGTPHSRATELLASEAMNQLLKDLASRYADRIIIFDSPPLLVTTEARVLAMHMGQVVVVVEAENTAQAAVKQALATIEACPIKLMALNKGRSALSGDAYGYGYGYGYGR
jgi:protein-tyrosine kinase